MTEHNEKDFIKKVLGKLDSGTERLEPGIQARLNRIRSEALEKAGRKWFDFRLLFRKPVFGLATASALLLAMTFYMWPTQPLENPIEDIEILSSVDNIDFYQNLDFYNWLSDEYKNAG